MRKPLVSVLMPFYDDGTAPRREYCAQAIESVLAQTMKDFELVFVVSGKREFAEKLAERSRRIRMTYFKQKVFSERIPVAEKTSGLVKARELSLKNARADVVAFADSDDISCPDRLKIQYEFLKKHPEVGVVGTGMIIIDDKGNKIGERGAIANDGEIRENVLSFWPVQQSTAMARARCLKKAGGYAQGILAEDYDLFVRALMITKFHNIQKPLVKYRVHAKGGIALFKFTLFKVCLKERIKVSRRYGIRWRANDVVMVFLQFLALFYPEAIGKKAYIKMSDIALSLLHLEFAPERKNKKKG